MRVSLIKKDNVQDLILPERVYGSFWLTDIDENGNERNIICVESFDNKWRIVSNNNAFCVEDKKVIPYVFLINHQFIPIMIRDYNNGKPIDTLMYIYVSPTLDTYKLYDIASIESKGIRISNVNTEISYNNNNLNENYAVIQLVNNQFRLTTHGLVFINGERVYNEQIVQNGDVIFIFGLRIILVIKENKHYLLINNPASLVITTLPVVIDNSEKINKFDITQGENIDIPLYTENDYYHKNPRFKTKINEFEITIDPPPEPKNNEGTPLLLTVVPMMIMSMTSLISGYNSYVAVSNGNVPLRSALPSIVMAISMVITSLLWPIIMRKYNKSENEKYNKLREDKYTKYVQEKLALIKNEAINQKTKLIDMYPSTYVSMETILKRMTRLWERVIEDEDFLTVNLGNGTREMNIKINYPSERFTLAEDYLKKMVTDITTRGELLNDVPIELSLKQKDKVAIIGDINDTTRLMRQLLVQILAFQSYDDLRIVVFSNKENEKNWDFLKSLPYLWNNEKSIRFFGLNTEENKEICYYLDSILNSRAEVNDNSLFTPHYLIFTDSYKTIRNFDFIKRLLDTDNKGFSFVILSNKITSIPEQFKTFVNINKDGHGELVETSAGTMPIKFEADFNNNYNLDKVAKILANLPLEITNDENGELPDTLGFLEMYNVGKVDQLNSISRWARSNPILSLHAPVGVGSNGEKIEIDLHEKYHGPHGLIAGMTGSGKSEFIITYILSMAINYDPREVQFILIDYKGGGLANILSNSKYKLPHLVGTITNLDSSEIKRSLASIESELKRRQAIFNKARDISGESVIDIYKYQKMYREGIVDEPVSHLFIISDEFAELKVQEPEFMSQLIQTARIGRSLGVHLILATQKPSGVVDSQIWSNTRFRVCLRVQEQSDSTEVIKRPDAAFLKQTGRFYFQVGFNESFVLGQSAWSGKQYIPTNGIAKKENSDMSVINNIGYVLKTITPTVVVNTKNYGEEVSNIVKYLDEIGKESNIKVNKLWLDRIPNKIYIDDLISKYNYLPQKFNLNPIIGEYDDPSRQMQNLLTIPFTENGNLLLYGIAGSGKSDFLSTMIYSINNSYSKEEVNIYGIDAGSGVLTNFNGLSVVGDIVSSLEEEKCNNLFKMINTNIEERKRLFQSTGGSYTSYVKNNSIPAIVVFINEMEAFSEIYEDYNDILIELTRDSNKYGIYFVLTVSTPNGLRLKLKQNFATIFTLNQNNKDDYSTILGNVKGMLPSKNTGRGLLRLDKVYEFQTASITKEEDVATLINSLKVADSSSKIPTLPNKVSFKDISKHLGKKGYIVPGINKNDLSVSLFNYRNNLFNIVTGQEMSVLYKFIEPLMSELFYLRDSIYFFNCDTYSLDESYQKYSNYFDTKYEVGVSKLYETIHKHYDTFVNNNYDAKVLDNVNKYTVVILNLNNFMTRQSLDSKDKFNLLLNEAMELDILNFIIIDEIEGIHRYQLDPWFKKGFNELDGIWIGNGINDQYTIKVSKRIPEMKSEIDDNYAFVISKGKASLVKIIEDFKVKFKQ